MKRLLNDTGSDLLSPFVRFHYPGQHLLTLPRASRFGNINTYIRNEAFLNDLEIIKGRNSRKRSCTPYNDIVSFDDMVKEKHVRSIGCAPPYFQSVLGVTKCSTKDKIKQSKYNWNSIQGKNYPPCCKRISKLAITMDYTEGNYEILRFDIAYPRYAKIIAQSKDVDIHALIGNIGGYVGLFLGMFKSQHGNGCILNYKVSTT